MSTATQKFTIGDVIMQLEYKKSLLLDEVMEIDETISKYSANQVDHYFCGTHPNTSEIVPGQLDTYLGKTLRQLADYLSTGSQPFAVFDLTEYAQWHNSECAGTLLGEAFALCEFIRANMRYRDAVVVRCNEFEGQTVLRVRLT